MRLFTKISLALAAILISIAIAPAAKADPVTISSGGFNLSNLANDVTGTECRLQCDRLIRFSSFRAIGGFAAHRQNGGQNLAADSFPAASQETA